MKKYKHLFFDLDRTIWDFDRNTSDTLLEIYVQFKLNVFEEDPQNFIWLYNKYNDWAWEQLRNRRLNKKLLRYERFRLLLKEYNISNENLIDKMQKYFVANSPHKPLLIEGANEILGYLHPRYKLYIVSNGFHDTQIIKLNTSGTINYFSKIFTSERLGYAKPNPAFYRQALTSVNARKKESLFIGDDIQNDVIGPGTFDVDQIWYNPENQKSDFKPTYTINHLIKLKELL